MTDEQTRQIIANIEEFSKRLLVSLEKNGFIECECPNCTCEKKEKLPVGSFHVFMDPKEYKCYAVCTFGLSRLSQEGNFWDQIEGPGMYNQ